jgi:hypothetical protein
MSHPRLALLALTAIALAASGCGGSSKTESTTTAASTTTPATTAAAKTEAGKSLTRTELIAEADTICARLNAKRAAYPIRTRQDYARVLPLLAAYDRAAAAEMSKLAPPASMANDWKLIVADTQTLADDTSRLSAYIASSNSQAGSALLSAVAKVDQQTLATAKYAGFKDCARA